MADTSHAHHKSYYVTDSDMRVQIPGNDTMPAQLWTVRKNVDGRLWYTHNATGYKTHIKPVKRSILDSTGLPLGWEERRTPDGRTFFFNASTGSSAWNKPQNTLPPGWKEVKTPDLVPFYVHEELGLSTWDRPGQQPKYRSTRSSYKMNGSSSHPNGGTSSGSSLGNPDMSFLSATKAAAKLTSRMLGKRKNLVTGKNLVTVARLANQANNLISGDDYGSTDFGGGDDCSGDTAADGNDAEFEEQAPSEQYQVDQDYQPDESFGQQDQTFVESPYAETAPPISDVTQDYPPSNQQPLYQQQQPSLVEQQAMLQQQSMLQQQIFNSMQPQASSNFNPVPSLQQEGYFIQSQDIESLQFPMQSLQIDSELVLPDQSVSYSSPEMVLPTESSYTLDSTQSFDFGNDQMSATSGPLQSPDQDFEVIVDSSVTFTDATGTTETYSNTLVIDDGQAFIVETDQVIPQSGTPSENPAFANVIQTDPAFTNAVVQNDSVLVNQYSMTGNTVQQPLASPPLQTQQTQQTVVVSSASPVPPKTTPQDFGVDVAALI